MKMKQKKLIPIILGIVGILIIGGGIYLYSENNAMSATSDTTPQVNGESVTEHDSNDQSSKTKQFRLYKKHEGYVYLLEVESIHNSDLVYYKSTEMDKFKNYNEYDYLQITAGSYTELPTPEEQYVGIKDYSVQITKEIRDISKITLVSKYEPGS